MSVVLLERIIGGLWIVRSFFHNVDLPVQTLVVNLSDMLFLRVLYHTPDIVHITSFGLILNLLNDSWVLWDNVMAEVLLRQWHSFNWVCGDVDVLRFGVVEHVVIADVIERKCFLPNFGSHGDAVLLGVWKPLGHQIVPDTYRARLDEIEVRNFILFV